MDSPLLFGEWTVSLWGRSHCLKWIQMRELLTLCISFSGLHQEHMDIVKMWTKQSPCRCCSDGILSKAIWRLFFFCSKPRGWSSSFQVSSAATSASGEGSRPFDLAYYRALTDVGVFLFPIKDKPGKFHRGAVILLQNVRVLFMSCAYPSEIGMLRWEPKLMWAWLEPGLKCNCQLRYHESCVCVCAMIFAREGFRAVLLCCHWLLFLGKFEESISDRWITLEEISDCLMSFLYKVTYYK